MVEQKLNLSINDQEAEYQNCISELEKQKCIFKKKTLVFSGIYVAVLIGLLILSSVSRSNAYSIVKDVDINDPEAMSKLAVSVENLAYTDLYDKYEAACLGNKSINGLNYGLVAENKYGYVYVNENGAAVLHSNGQETIIATERISQINIAEALVFYRGADRKLYSCNYDGSDKKAITDCKVGTTVLWGDEVYYINYDKENNLYKYIIKDGKNEPVIDKEINTFTLVADSILYTDSSGILVLQKMGSSSPEWKLPNVAKFYFNGDIYVQNNDNVIKFNINKHSPENIVTGVNELLGVDENSVFYTKDNQLYSQDLISGESVELNYSFDYYKGVYSANGQITALGGNRK